VVGWDVWTRVPWCGGQGDGRWTRGFDGPLSQRLVKLMSARNSAKTFLNSYSLYIPKATLRLDLHIPMDSRQRFVRYPPVDAWFIY